ncbi:hypothetical protein [Microcystis aeruginosa]|uniref:hypothetical protein n=1 Tax=Microcystis aeruginosa TaxID=1126 RepID=UPI0012DA8B22|nr:hypothetical protein [Microcystis aeruginosa]
MLLKLLDSLILCVINLTYIVVIDLCVLCVSVVRSPHYLLPAVFIDYLDQKSGSSLLVMVR